MKRYNMNIEAFQIIKHDIRKSSRVCSVANQLHHNLFNSCAFSVASFVISGGYYRGSFESVIKAIVR